MNRRHFIRDAAIATGLIFVPSHFADARAGKGRRSGAVRAASVVTTPLGGVTLAASTNLNAGALTGAGSAKLFLFSCWFNRSGGDGTLRCIYKSLKSSAVKVQVYLSTSNKLVFYALTTAGTNVLQAISSVTFAATGWHHVVFSCDLSDVAKRHMVIDGTNDASVNWAVYSNNNYDHTGTSNNIGSDGAAGGYWLGSLGQILCVQAYYDVLTNIAQFYSGAKPVLYANQAGTPLFYLKNGASTFGTDAGGNANNFTVSSGSLSDIAI